MKRNTIIETLNQDKLHGHKQRVAFHEAGHAAGIHLNNKTRQLPSVYFNIILKDSLSETDSYVYHTNPDDFIARVEGGRLIKLLPFQVDSPTQVLTEPGTGLGQSAQHHLTAFEADITNLLIGPLAEAKYSAKTDNESFNHKLVNLNALKNYGGNSDLVLANDYLQCFFDNEQQREAKLAELFSVAFDFINCEANWAAITKLANYIVASRKNFISCEEIASMLDQAVINFHHRKNRLDPWPFYNERLDAHCLE